MNETIDTVLMSHYLDARRYFRECCRLAEGSGELTPRDEALAEQMLARATFLEKVINPLEPLPVWRDTDFMAHRRGEVIRALSAAQDPEMRSILHQIISTIMRCDQISAGPFPDLVVDLEQEKRPLEPRSQAMYRAAKAALGRWIEGSNLLCEESYQVTAKRANGYMSFILGEGTPISLEFELIPGPQGKHQDLFTWTVVATSVPTRFDSVAALLASKVPVSQPEQFWLPTHATGARQPIPEPAFR